ncbi:MAG: type II toxin-antitoxin system Phd/YefM family antitoxin [Firmicutes bacterium]|nr:type II toxin-antitoxin system Phd/YefM family antitoxin [Bacillota bacterium]
MLIDTNLLVPMTDANQNFSKVVRMVDRDGMAVILKNNQPKYVVVDFSEYDKIAAALQMRKQLIDTTADSIIEDNLEAFLELAK